MEGAAAAPAAGATASSTSSSSGASSPSGTSSSSGTPSSRAQIKGMLKPNLEALAQVPPATINTLSG
jgi:hypothetical protein